MFRRKLTTYSEKTNNAYPVFAQKNYEIIRQCGVRGSSYVLNELCLTRRMYRGSHHDAACSDWRLHKKLPRRTWTATKNPRDHHAKTLYTLLFNHIWRVRTVIFIAWKLQGIIIITILNSVNCILRLCVVFMKMKSLNCLYLVSFCPAFCKIWGKCIT